MWKKIALIASAAVTLIGAFLPWVTIWVVSANLTSSSTFGLFLLATLATGGLGVANIFVDAKWMRILTGVVGIVAALMVLVSCIDIYGNAAGVGISLGIGAIVSILGGIGMLVFSIMTLTNKEKVAAGKKK